MRNVPEAGSRKPLFSPARDIRPRVPSTVRSSTSSSGLRTGSVRSRNSLTRLKTAVLAPMPNASDSTATAVKPGFLTSWRSPNLKSSITLSDWTANGA